MATSLYKIREDIRSERDLGKSLTALQPLMNQWNVPELTEEYEKIAGDYQLMKDFLLRGYSDPQRPQLYDSLLSRLYRITWNLELHIARCSNPTLAKAFNKANREFQGVDILRQKLEQYVEEYALVSLSSAVPAEGKGEQAETYTRLNAAHQQTLDTAFSWIITSGTWSDAEAIKWRELLVSSTIDATDAALLVSAVMLSGMHFLDTNKIAALIDVYSASDIEMVRQRALVGIAFSMRLYSNDDSIKDRLSELLSDESVQRELTQLQEQVFLCTTAEKDTRIVHEEIMPDIMKSHPFGVDINHLSDIDSDDNLAEMFSVDEDDENIDRIEKSIERMAQMQREGADIYYGGFSHMKRLPFFYTLSNWFMPFTINHPALEQVREGKAAQLLDIITRMSPLCDSDKYSFALVLPSVVSKMSSQSPPGLSIDDILEALPAEMSGLVDDTISSAAYQRRLYLQSLYRFFRLSDFRSDFHDPFGLFICSFPSSCRKWKTLPSFARMLYKRKFYCELQDLFDWTHSWYWDEFSDSDQIDMYMMDGRVSIWRHAIEGACARYEKGVRRFPDNEPLRYAYVKTLLAARQYERASREVGPLLLAYPDDLRYQYLSAMSLMAEKKAAAALPSLFRLNYEHPDDPETAAALAWALLMTGQAEKAEQQFRRLTATPQSRAADAATIDDDPKRSYITDVTLGLAYTLWAQGKMAESITLFSSRYPSDGSRQPTPGYISPSEVLAPYPVTPTDMKIVADLIFRS